MTYQWIPGQGPSPEAIERMRVHFRRPPQPMGEAWFMGERRMFTELMDRPVSEQPIELLEQCLSEIASGISCFGHHEEWGGWFKYLLPDVIIRGNEHYAFDVLVEATVSAFMNVFWTGIPEEYPGFRVDVFNSLGVSLMSSECWLRTSDCDTDLRPAFLICENDEGLLEPAFWDAGETNNALSCLLFFCLKYLPVDAIPAWVASLMAIEDPYWRGALMVWLLGAQKLLEDEPLLPDRLNKAQPKIHWNNSHTLGTAPSPDGVEEELDEGFNNNKLFLSIESNKVFLSEVRRNLTPEVLLRWTDSIASEPLLKEALLNTPEQLFDKVTTSTIN